MNRCGTCKHWTSVEDPHGFAVGASGTDPEFRPCARIVYQDDDYGSTPEPGTIAYPRDHSGYFATLRVAADFGCVLWETG